MVVAKSETAWSKLPIWAFTQRKVVKNRPDEQLLSVYRDWGVVPKDSRDDNHNRASEDLSAYQFVEPGDLVLNKMKTWQGSIAVSDHQGIVSPAYYVCSVSGRHDRRFLHHLLRHKGMIEEYRARSKGIRPNQWDLPFDEFRAIKVAIPPIEEQQIIAAYLDRETGRIDALVERLERLIALLTEKRQAVISHAVTKGLNPDAPMKDSGIDWLGDVPAHWEVKRLKHIVVPKGVQIGPFGQFLKEHTVDASTTKLVGQENVLSNDFAKGDRWISDDQYEAVPQYWVVEGDILFTRKGSIGKCSIVPSMVGRAIIDSDTIRVRLDETIAETAFVRLALTQSTMSEVQTRLNARGAILSGVNSETLGNMVLCLPPLAEQVDLMIELDSQLEEFASAIEYVEKMITASKERRSALISAAVTGQIPVADMIPVTTPEDAA